MTTNLRTFGDVLRDVYSFHLSSLTDEHQASLWARDWPTIERGLAPVLAKIGGATFAMGRDVSDLGPIEIVTIVLTQVSPLIVARIVNETSVRLVAASGAEANGMTCADLFDVDGNSLE